MQRKIFTVNKNEMFILHAVHSTYIHAYIHIIDYIGMLSIQEYSGQSSDGDGSNGTGPGHAGEEGTSTARISEVLQEGMP